MAVLIRPGSPTANQIIRRREMTVANAVPVRVDGWHVFRVTHEHLTDADTSQVLTLNTLFPENPFPANVQLLRQAYFDLREVFAAPAMTDLDFILGITGNTNGLVEVTAAETGQSLGYKCPGGDLYVTATLFQAAMSPLLQADSVGANLSACTTGVLDIYIPYTLMCSNRPA